MRIVVGTGKQPPGVTPVALSEEDQRLQSLVDQHQDRVERDITRAVKVRNISELYLFDPCDAPI